MSHPSVLRCVPRSSVGSARWPPSTMSSIWAITTRCASTETACPLPSSILRAMCARDRRVSISTASWHLLALHRPVPATNSSHALVKRQHLPNAHAPAHDMRPAVCSTTAPHVGRRRRLCRDRSGGDPGDATLRSRRPAACVQRPKRKRERESLLSSPRLSRHETTQETGMQSQ